jgi:hypothetical protein
MKPLEIVYWLRLGLGVVAAFVSLGYAVAAYNIPLPSGSQVTIFLNSMSLAIIVYLLSYYAIKARFRFKVQRTQKLFTTGIGIYFLSWITFYTLLYTLFSGI